MNSIVRTTEDMRKFSIAREWGNGSFLHVCFESVGCRFRKMGYCSMCDYGQGSNITADEAVSALKNAENRASVPIQRLLLGTCGSILDEKEMHEDVLESILAHLKETEIPYIIFETHYSTVTEEKLKKIRNMLPEKNITIEMGFESANPYVLKHCLNKFMDLSKLEQAVRLIHSHQCAVSLNVFLGAPGLSGQEQSADAKQAVAWAKQRGADEIVLFPANIKPGTKLWKMYQAGEYHRVTHRQVVELLHSLSDDELEIVAVSWYGDRQLAGEDTDILPPYIEKQKEHLMIDFYRQFMGDFDVSSRRKAIQDIEELFGWQE